jgi:uncharacterized membrane protein
VTAGTARVLARLRREEDGQLLLLVLLYTVIAGLLVTVVVDLSTAYLHRRSLLAAADGAALAAANQPDLAAVYTGGGDTLPLSGAGARAAVQQYAADARLGDRFDGFTVQDVDVRGATVTVRFGAAVRLPFVRLVAWRWRDGYPVQAAASARSPLLVAP